MYQIPLVWNRPFKYYWYLRIVYLHTVQCPAARSPQHRVPSFMFYSTFIEIQKVKNYFASAPPLVFLFSAQASLTQWTDLGNWVCWHPWPKPWNKLSNLQLFLTKLNEDQKGTVKSLPEKYKMTNMEVTCQLCRNDFMCKATITEKGDRAQFVPTVLSTTCWAPVVKKSVTSMYTGYVPHPLP